MIFLLLRAVVSTPTLEAQTHQVENPYKYFLLLYGDKNIHVDDRTKMFFSNFVCLNNNTGFKQHDCRHTAVETGTWNLQSARASESYVAPGCCLLSVQ